MKLTDTFWNRVAGVIACLAFIICGLIVVKATYEPANDPKVQKEVRNYLTQKGYTLIKFMGPAEKELCTHKQGTFIKCLQYSAGSDETKFVRSGHAIVDPDGTISYQWSS